MVWKRNTSNIKVNRNSFDELQNLANTQDYSNYFSRRRLPIRGVEMRPYRQVQLIPKCNQVSTTDKSGCIANIVQMLVLHPTIFHHGLDLPTSGNNAWNRDLRMVDAGRSFNKKVNCGCWYCSQCDQIWRFFRLSATF